VCRRFLLEFKFEPVDHLLDILIHVPAAVGKDAIIRSGHGGGIAGGVCEKEPMLHPLFLDRLIEDAVFLSRSPCCSFLPDMEKDLRGGERRRIVGIARSLFSSRDPPLFDHSADIFPRAPMFRSIGTRTLDIISKNRLNVTKSEREWKMLKVSAILLGAGESKRMGANKLALPWGKKTVFEHCLDTLLRSDVSEVVVVLGKKTKDMRCQLEKTGAKVVLNPFYRKGMSTSIRKGIRAIDPGSEGILIALGDQPFLKTATINALVRAFTSRKHTIIVPSFQGQKGHPVIFHRKYEKELLRLKGEGGAKSIIERHPGDVRVVRVTSGGVVKDIDTRDDYRKGMRFFLLM
jgi:molybdenum cofactor cytidylyltransferase